jgi:hypothetical protein
MATLGEKVKTLVRRTVYQRKPLRRSERRRFWASRLLAALTFHPTDQ